MEMKFCICKHCGNIIAYVENKGVKIFCCGEKMTELVPNTVDASQEKHLPVYSVEGNTVKVSIGSVAHPMTEEHYIKWVVLQTEKGNQRRELAPDTAPEVTFPIESDDKVTTVYAYCNLHGLWKV